MSKKPYKDVTDKCRNMRKSKLLAICQEELSEEETKIFLMRVYQSQYNRDRIADEVGRCKESVSNIFMRAVRKLRDVFKDEEN